MSTITLRATKGSPLTNTEVDNNFSNLNTDKIQSTYAGALDSLTGGTSIATVGTVTAGTWSASTIAANKGGTGVANNVASTLTISGAYGTTLTVGATTALTLPAAGTVATLAGSEAFTNKSYNGMTLTSTTGTFTLTNAKTFAVQNTITLAGTDATTITLPSITGTVALNNQTHYIGTTSIAINRASLAQALTGITSIDGSAATLTTARAIYGNNFDGSAALTGVIASTYGGTGNGFTKFSGPTTAERTFTLPDATETVLTSNAAVTAPQGGTGQTTYTIGDLLYASTSSALSKLVSSTSGYVLTAQGAGVAPVWAASAGATTGKAIAMAMVFGG